MLRMLKRFGFKKDELITVMLRMLKRFGFKKDELITVYKGYIRPLLEYTDVV